jgi:hypothetical protein
MINPMPQIPPDSQAQVLLIEGVPGIGKSTILDSMLRSYIEGEAEGKLRTVTSLAQTHTYGPIAVREDLGTLTKEENLNHLDYVVTWLEWIAKNSKNQHRPKSFLLIDTLHLTQCLRPGVVKWEDVISFDRRLTGIGCKLLLFDANDDTILKRTIEARTDTEFIRGYALGRFGQDKSELLQHFHNERNAFREMYSASSMKKLCLMSEASIEETTASAARFWLSPDP